MTTDENADTLAFCAYCEGAYPAERAEIGYPYCMKPGCVAEGKAAKNAAPIEVVFTEADTARF